MVRTAEGPKEQEVRLRTFVRWNVWGGRGIAMDQHKEDRSSFSDLQLLTALPWRGWARRQWSCTPVTFMGKPIATAGSWKKAILDYVRWLTSRDDASWRRGEWDSGAVSVW